MPFYAGNKLARGGPRPGSGRKSDALKAELQDLIRETVPREKLKSIIEVMSHLANAGDTKAAAWLFDRLYGRPVQHLEVSDEAESVPYDLSRLTEEELDTLERLTRKAALVSNDDSNGEIAP